MGRPSKRFGLVLLLLEDQESAVIPLFYYDNDGIRVLPLLLCRALFVI